MRNPLSQRHEAECADRAPHREGVRSMCQQPRGVMYCDRAASLAGPATQNWRLRSGNFMAFRPLCTIISRLWPFSGTGNSDVRLLGCRAATKTDATIAYKLLHQKHRAQPQVPNSVRKPRIGATHQSGLGKVCLNKQPSCIRERRLTRHV